ncbi:MAG: hypothetical protein AAFU41_09240 [Pseudomonadota bacterium]
MPDGHAVMLRPLVFLLFVAACGSGGSTAMNPGSDSGSGSGGSSGGSGGGGSGGGGSGESGSLLNIASDAERTYFYGDFQTEIDAVQLASTMGGPTSLSNVPASGATSYAGVMEMLIGNSMVNASVTGHATMTVTLTAGLTTGTVTDFMGVAMDEAMVSQVVNYEGTVTLSGGAVTAGPGNLAAMSIDIDGSIDSGLDTFGINGTLHGYLYGQNAEGLRVTGSHAGIRDDLDGTVNGSGPVDLAVATIWAVRD